jgi:hypothetical protein
MRKRQRLPIEYQSWLQSEPDTLFRSVSRWIAAGGNFVQAMMNHLRSPKVLQPRAIPVRCTARTRRDRKSI